MASKFTFIIFLFAILCLLSHVDAKKAIGSVKVVVLDGEELADKDRGADLSDPYVRLWIDGNSKKTTTVKKNTLNTYWGETFFFKYYPGPHKLHVEVWDRDYGRDKDDLMGKAVVNLDNYCKPTAAAPVCSVDGVFAEFDDSHFNYVLLDLTWSLF
ncbi:252_t:CDS:2 [Paraglomus brasilianum]|uniref:252_t:CDS:1 n=1 Tax=Paraglomus brasilianum TaxID=144538 RepID=A0A9N9G6R8_9GLOM|nr:252_t:CDS:2 [Paraglomus brasilianum]